ncbi:MAG: metallophosphoesterase family protein [Desulfococcaceae bacterium]
MGDIYAVGDVHGCHEKMVNLIDRLEIDFRRDQLIFLGDYIDRGDSAFDVVDYLLELKARHPEIIFLRGNHEAMFDGFLSGKDRYAYLVNGGQQTLESYLKQGPGAKDPPIPPRHRRFFEGLSLYYETDEFIFVHAGLRPGVPLEKQKPEDMLWIREKFIRSNYDFGKRVVFGHTPFTEPLVQKNKIGIDTGAVYGNKLTCVRLPALEFIQV